MKRMRVLIIAGIMATLVVSGCSPETRYTVLSFFFDGVPQPGEQTSNVYTGRKTKALPRKTATPYRAHGPYAAKMCEACHERGGGNKLILPVEKLCLNCHVLNIQKKKVHGPVASGGCRVCHEPHGSGKPFLLVSEPAKFCFHCHDEAEVGAREVHKAAGGAECTDCHDAHSSDNDFLLK